MICICHFVTRTHGGSNSGMSLDTITISDIDRNTFIFSGHSIPAYKLEPLNGHDRHIVFFQMGLTENRDVYTIACQVGSELLDSMWFGYSSDVLNVEWR